jgi:hypothetical protein
VTFPGCPERSRGWTGVKAALTRAASRSESLIPASESRQIIPTSGKCPHGSERHLEPDAMRSTTDSLCAGDRRPYRADIVIVSPETQVEVKTERT